jgi:membrane carboxypeptidase/penicillin-binding protein PbpC
VEGGLSERVVCRVVYVASDEQLWWFVDGLSHGKTVGTQPFVLKMEEGEHSVVAVNGEGKSSQIRFKVLKELTRKEGAK